MAAAGRMDTRDARCGKTERCTLLVRNPPYTHRRRLVGHSRGLEVSTQRTHVPSAHCGVHGVNPFDTPFPGGTKSQLHDSIDDASDLIFECKRRLELPDRQYERSSD